MEELEKIFSTGTNEAELSLRAANSLERGGVLTIGQLLKLSEIEMLKWKNFGRKSLLSVKQGLYNFGIRLDEDIRDAVIRNQGVYSPHGDETFSKLMRYKPFRFATESYWQRKFKDVPFRTFLKLFEAYVPHMDFDGYGNVAERTGLDSRFVYLTLRRAARAGIIPRVNKRWKDRNLHNEIYADILLGMNQVEIAKQRGVTRSAVQAYMGYHGLLKKYHEVQAREA